MSHSNEKLGFNATWSMAVGGMVGGGIFSTLGVVIGIAGPLAWFSFVAAGMIALAAGYSYVELTRHYHKGGGAFTFLRQIGAMQSAGTLAWVLIMGYVLTNAVYAFTFGQYLGHVVGLGPWFARAAAIAIMAVFIGLNLRSLGQSSTVEVILVWAKLAVLVLLAGFGLYQWEPQMLSRGAPDAEWTTALFGAAAVFMAYEGFQLLAYDYEDIDAADKTLPRAVLSAIVVVIVVYVLVALGTPMLIGADGVIEHKEVALALAGEQAFGMAGLVVVTIAAAFSTGSAINSTLFATARLAREVTRQGELPAAVDHENRFGIPDRAVLGLGILAAAFAALGTLSGLVEAASLAFLCTFTIVGALAFHAGAGSRWITGFGAVSAAAAAIALMDSLWHSEPIALIMFVLLCLVALFVRPRLLKRTRTREPTDD
ncbi:APC family permease [Dokdonella sp.]|uniref:APC family permease n=1 Tax=Dokdonella sp. TaxID=2291710 RepID=UPI003527210B